MVRILSMPCAAACLLMALSLWGCASWCPPKDTVRTNIPPVRYPDAPGCACTLEHRMNLCVTVNGATSIPDSLEFVREREDGGRDSLSGSCFGESRGIQRVLMLRGMARIDSTGWFELQTVDCCHAEAKTLDFKR
jgi:hypothetical protein